jgi:hypothetical protein
MYAFLLVLGAVIAAAGLVLVGSGISIEERAFDPTNVTPGTIAVIGGCILIGLAFVVRALLRVERALMVRPMPRAARPGETPDVAVVAQSSEVPAAVTAPAGETRSESGSASSPDRLENGMVVEDREVSLSPKAPVQTEEKSEAANQSLAARTNGAAQAKATPQIATSGRPVRRPQQQGRNSIFDTLWPKGQRAAPEIHAAPMSPSPAAPPSAAEPAMADVAQPATQSLTGSQEGAAVSILKSGVVEGMAYTLYSDGSIEAQLPGGTLRFGSITELRNHIEQNG